MKKLLFILLTVLLMLPAAMRAQETLTVADGTESSEYLPLYGGYVDSEQKTQMIYPASMLEGLEGAEISSLTFYSSYSNEALPVFTIKIGETTTSFFSSTTFLPTTSMTTVYNGTLTISGGEMTIQFSTPYTYNGGNLILDFSTNGGSDYIWGLDFTGITSNGGGIWYYSYYDWYYDDYEEDEDIEDFLPKLTISYTGGAGVTCPAISALTVSDVDNQSATLSWTAGGEESSWDIYYTTTATDVPDETTEPMATSFDVTYQLSGLEASTTYYVYVRANCGTDDVSRWRQVTFSTSQVAAELPYTQDWEDDEENSQWQFVHSDGDNKWAVGTAVNHTEEGTQSLYVSNNNGMSNAYTNNSTSHSWAYRDIDFGTNAEYVLSFDWNAKGESCCDYLKIYVGTPVAVSSSSYDDPAGATLVGTYNNQDNWQHVDATITSEHQGVQRLYLLWRNDYSIGTNPPAAIDNIELTGSDCGTPRSVTVTEVTADAITISFVPASENDDTWEVAILHHGDTIDENTEIITVYDTTYTFEALDANTVYDVYVRTACGSLWKTATSIHTECVAVTNLPFVDNFDNAPSSSVMPYCWTRTSDYPYTTTTHYSAPYSLYFYTSSNTSNLAAAPEFDESIDISTLQTTFMYKTGGSSSYMIVGVMTDPENTTTFVAVDTVYPDASSYSTWVEREVKFDTYTGEGHYIAFKHVGATYSASYIDDVMIYPIPSCVRPDVVTVDDVTATSASITWIPVGDESAWEYLCVPYGTEVDETTAEWTNTSEANAEITDLTGNTKYTFYVRAYCSDQDQSLARTMDFRTDCDIQSIPYTEDFESFTTSDPVYCWTVMSGSATISTSYPCSGTKSLRLSGTTNNMVAMPALDREISEVELSFSTRPESFTYDDCGSFQVGYVTDLTSPSSFVAVETYAYDDFTDCQNIDVTFTNAPAGSYIAFRQFDCADNWYWFIDDIDVHEIPSCIKPTNFRVVSSFPTSVSLEWEDAGTAMTWNVAYGTGSFNPDQATNVETVYDTYVEITDVTPGVANTFYVQADCGGETSRWNGPLSIIPGVYTFGHTGSDTIIGCGYTLYDEGGASGSYTDNADFTLVIYPEEEGQHVGVTGTYETESSWDKLYIYDGAGANDAMLIHTLSGSGSIPANTVSSSGPMTIRFTSDYSSCYSGFELHTNCQSCVAPMLIVDEISSTNVTLTWDDAEGTMTAWQLVYGEAPLTIDEDEVIDVYSNIYPIEGLTPNTAYEAYIRVLCDNGEYSEWSQALNFRTPCAAETIPYTENFETYTSGMPDCWTKLRSNTTSYPQISTYSSSKILRSAGNTMFVSPMLDEDITTLQMVVDIRKEGASSGSLEIGVMTNPYDESTFEVVETIPTTETNYSMTEHTVIFTNVTNNGNYIAFRQTSTATNYYFDIDNIVVEPIPACPKPMAVQAINVASTSATIGWQESGDAYTWNIEYGPAGFTPGTGTMLTDIMDNPYELTGLTPTTSYDVYVQSNCDADGTSSWSAKCNFTTECAVYELPFTENFTTSSMPNCWNLYSGIFGTETPTTTTSGWTFSNTYVFGHVHPKVNIYGTGCNYWLVSPVIDLATAETPVLSFNLALTAWNSSSAPSSTSDDDKFIVAISTDNGATWSTDNAVIWNDGDPTADHSYSAISTTGEAIHIDLSDYVGQEIKIAFYGESTVSGGDNDLHIDAVMVYDGEIPVTCDVPTNLSSNNVQYNSANITWTAGGSESAWNLQWRAQNGTWTPVNNLTAANYSLNGLTAQTTYEVQVQAVCDGSTTSDWTAIHSFTTPAAPAEPCDAPTNLQITSITTNSAVASWNAGGSETSWKVGYKLQSAGQWQEATVSTTTYNIEGLTANSTYDFRVKAVCSADNQSDFVTTSFTTSPVGINNVELSNSVSLMPNPADNYIEMTVNGNVNVKEAAIYNAFGQMIQMVQLTDNHARINLDNYASGMYFVRVAGDNAVATKKFIKK